jgi:pimeloyl-ACP methyl ester carboxylesterase
VPAREPKSSSTKLDSLSLLGHSHGGTIALGYAITHPERVENLILVDSDIEDYPDEQRDSMSSSFGVETRILLQQSRSSRRPTILTAQRPTKSWTLS